MNSPIERVSYKVVTFVELNILLNLVQEFHEVEKLPFMKSVDRSVLKDFLNNKSYGRSWLIYQPDLVIGYILITFSFSLEFHGRIACIDELYLKEQYRGQGIGERTLKFVEDTCITLKIQKIYLEVAQNNTRAQDFYHRVGYSDRNYYSMIKTLS
jgi:ribosomal protein S18 acetylase RimI-like enzyme